MKNYIVRIWYRYVSFGEQQKDFEEVEVQAIDESEAKRKACDWFPFSNAIPFKTEIL